MSPGERRVLEFISSRLESMLRRPRVWGAPVSVEERILQLLELRRVLLVPSASAKDTQRLMRVFSEFIARELDAATAEPLAVQLERRGRSTEFSNLMAKFVDSEVATFLVEQRYEDSATESVSQAAQIEVTERVLESLRLDAEARERRRSGPPAEPIDFPDQKHS